MNPESLHSENHTATSLESCEKIPVQEFKCKAGDTKYSTQFRDLHGQRPVGIQRGTKYLASTSNCNTDIHAQSQVNCQTFSEAKSYKRKLSQQDDTACQGFDESSMDKDFLVIPTLTWPAEKSSRCTLYDELFPVTHTSANRLSVCIDENGNAVAKSFEKESSNIPGKIDQGPVDIADKAFNDKVYDFAQSTQTATKTFVCEICTRSFARNSNLKRHMLTHTGEKKYKCELCDESFAESGTLKYHVRTHAGKEEFKCEVCNLSFPKSVKLMRHMFIHTGEKGFKCEICNRTFSQSYNLKTHMFIHTGEKRFQCDICCRMFSEHASLKKHMVTHTGEKNFKCEICLQLFTVKSNLQTHMLLHAGVKRFKCEVCYRPFSQKGSLKKHMLTHAGE